MFGECMGRRSDDGTVCTGRMGASSDASRIERRGCGVPSLTGLMIGGRLFGTLWRVVRWCVLGVTRSSLGSVGLVLVVTVGCSTTLCIGSSFAGCVVVSPPEATLCSGVEFKISNARAICFKHFRLVGLSRVCRDSNSSRWTS